MEENFRFSPQIINTSSISNKDICIFEHTKNKIEYPCNLLFVGRICLIKVLENY